MLPRTPLPSGGPLVVVEEGSVTEPQPLPGLEHLEPDTDPAPVLAGARGPDAVYATARAIERRRQKTTFPYRVSEDRLLTAGRQALLAAGFHPLTRMPLAGNGETCGTCAHLEGDRGAWRKCGKHRRTSSRTTDVVMRWPACQLWEATSEETS